MKTKLQIIWRVLRGQPVCYRMMFADEVWLSGDLRDALIVDCTLRHEADSLRFSLWKE